MNRDELVKELLAGLIELEGSGDLVITSTSPEAVADQLCSGIIRKWATEFLDAPPSEVVISDGNKYSTKHLQEMFGIEETVAQSMVEEFVRQLQAGRTSKEVADLVSHQGAQEIAHGAYYCIHLQRGEYYGPGYIDWRKEVYAQMRSR